MVTMTRTSSAPAKSASLVESFVGSVSLASPSSKDCMTSLLSLFMIAHSRRARTCRNSVKHQLPVVPIATLTHLRRCPLAAPFQARDFRVDRPLHQRRHVEDQRHFAAAEDGRAADAGQ